MSSVWSKQLEVIHMIVICDRCGRQIEAMRIVGAGTCGFYEGEYWSKYMTSDEHIICDACMGADPGYQQDYKL